MQSARLTATLSHLLSIRIPVTSAILLLLSVGAGTIPAKPEGEGQAVILKELHGNAAEAARKALAGSTPDALAKTAFACFMESARPVTGPDSIKTILSFSSREGMFFTACAQVAIAGQREALVQALVATGRPEAHRLAAGSLLIAALAHRLASEQAQIFATWGRTADQTEGGGGDQARGTGGARKGGKGGGTRKGGARSSSESQAGLNVPAELIRAESPVTASMAIRAAAYAEDASVADAVAGRARGGPLLAAAVLLYNACLQRPVEEALVAAAFAPDTKAVALAPARPLRSRASGPVNVPDPLDVPAGCAASEALGLIGGDKYLPLLYRAAGHEDPRVRLEAARALRRIRTPETLSNARRWLRDAEWPVAIELAAMLGETPEAGSVVPLIDRLRRETGRLRLDLVHALSSIAGGQKAQTADGWAGWWKTNQASFAVDATASSAYRASTPVSRVDLPALGFFYGLAIHSDRFSYVVDASNSMKGKKFESLQRNLGNSLESLSKGVRYNLVAFGGDLLVMESDELIEDRRKGVRYASEMKLTLGTRAYDAMERAAQLPGVDTLLFLSDGAPVRGQVNPWLDLLRVLAVQNRYCPLSIYSVNFAPSPAHANSMRKLAVCNSGLNTDIDTEAAGF